MAIYDCRSGDQPILEVDIDGFKFRGKEGWGSISPLETDTSQFQQNPANTPVETVPDMFLNWVYRYNDNPENSDSFVGNGCNVDGSLVTPLDPDYWQDDPNTPNTSETYPSGFLNRMWKDTRSDLDPLPGTPDPQLSGDLRYIRMHGYIKELVQSGGY